MENYLYFAEADVETGDNGSSEALCVPASSFIGADPGDGTTTLRFKNAMGDNAGVHTVVLTHTAAKNKEVMRGVMACINARPSKGGFIIVANANAAALTTGVEYNKVFDGLGLSTVSITEVETGGVTGIAGDTTHSTSYGVGLIGTTTGNTPPAYNRSKIGNEIVTSVVVDLTGMTNKSDDGDVIGLAAGGAAYFFKYAAAETGTIYKIEMSCLELPTASSNVGLDIDLFSSSSAVRAYDFDISGATQVIAAGANMVLGDTLQNIADHGAANDYYYLVTGATHTGDSIHTAGRILIKFYGQI
tara:strand:+ start:43 stop:948 length:906 start_codon:yes stop_codon:yes gene_type:complete